MTISYTALLGLAQPVTGTETGQWGTVVNDEITALLEDAVANAASISVTAGNVTLSTTNGSSNQARMSTLIITGTPGTTRNVVAPSQAKIYVVINQSDGAVVIKGAATSGVTIGAGQTAQVAWNGSDFVEIGNYVHGNFVVNGNLSVNGDSTLGNAGADTTTINGQVIAANSNISKTTTLSASAPALAWIKGATYTDTGTAGGTTQALAPFTVFSTPTLSTSNIVTYTDAATVYIAGAPAAAGSATITNPYSLYVAAGNAYFGASVSATTLDLTNLEVTNIKAKDGTASMTLADSTGIITLSATAGTANGVAYLNGSRALTTGSALTFDGTKLGVASGNIDVVSASFVGSPLIAARFNASNFRMGIGIGNSNGFPFLGANVNNAANDNGTFDINGYASRIRLDNGVFQVQTSSASGTAGNAITWTTPLYLEADGDLGVGTTSPGTRLHASIASGTAYTTSSTGNVLTVSNTTASGYAGIAFNTEPSAGNAGIAAINSFAPASGDSVLAFSTRGSATLAERMRLDSSGNLGIGTSSPLARLSVQLPTTSPAGYTAATNSGITLDCGTSTNGVINLVGGGDLGIFHSNSSNAYDVGIGFGNNANRHLTFVTANAERMRLDSSGNLGIGTSAPNTILSVNAGDGVGVLSPVITTQSSTTTYGGMYAVRDGAGDQRGLVWQTFTANVGLGEKMRLDSSGNLGLGITPSAWGSNYRVLDIVQFGTRTASLVGGSGQTGIGLALGVYHNNTNWIATVSSAPVARYEIDGVGNHSFFTYNGTVTAGNTISFTQAMTLDSSGRLLVKATSNTGTNTKLAVGSGLTSANAVAVISTEDVDVDGIQISNWTGSATTNRVSLGFDSSGVGGFRIGIPGGVNAFQIYDAVAAAERARITSGGDFFIGNGETAASPSAGVLSATGGTGTNIAGANLTIRGGASTGSGAGGVIIFSTAAAGASGTTVRSATERARITSGGDLYVGTTGLPVSNGRLSVSASSGETARLYQSGGDGQPSLALDKSSTTNTTSQVFAIFTVNAQATGSGQINANGASQAAFGSFSDRRLKENIVDLESQWQNIKSLRPVEFDYVANEGGGHQIGFIAQEVQAAYPDLVGERSDGMLTLSGMGKNEARLIKALQEAMTRIEKLEAEVAALKGA